MFAELTWDTWKDHLDFLPLTHVGSRRWIVMSERLRGRRVYRMRTSFDHTRLQTSAMKGTHWWTNLPHRALTQSTDLITVGHSCRMPHCSTTSSSGSGSALTKGASTASKNEEDGTVQD